MEQKVDNSQWQGLLAEENINLHRKRAEDEYSKLADDELGQLRWMCKTDLFFFVHTILGYKRLSKNLHGHLCAWLARTAWEQFRLILLPRSHFKTTVVTIGESIQDALPVPNISGSTQNTIPYPASLGSDIRLLLCHETHEPGATRFLYEITSHFVSNPKLMGLFSECIPNPRLQRMNSYELELPRQGYWAEPTFDTMGVGARGQGRHYNKMKLDDIFGDKARDSRAERDRTIQWVDNIQSFLVRLAFDHIDNVGTRYSLDDSYQHLMTVYGPKIIKYIRRIEELNPSSGLLEPIFPEEFTTESLAILRKNPKVWAAQYANDPHEGLAEFNPAWKRWFNFAGRDRVAAFFGTVKMPTTYYIRDLDRCILIDPAISGRPGIVVTATDERSRVFVLEAIKTPMKPEVFVDTLFKLVLKWNPRVVSIEEVVFSAVFRPWIEREMQVRNLRFNIQPYKPPRGERGNPGLGKPKRVQGLANYFSSGQILFHEGLTDLIWEYDNFGATDDYHLLDALAQGMEVWRPGKLGSWLEQNRKLEEQMMNDRDFVTGYSSL